MKKYLLPIGILAGVGIVYLILKNKERNQRIPINNQNPIQNVPQYVETPQKKALKEQFLTALHDSLLTFYQSNPPNILTQHGSSGVFTPNYNEIANNDALKLYNCMLPDLNKMDENELNSLLDYYKNGVPQDILKYQAFLNAASRFPLAYSDHPCSDSPVKVK